MPDLTGRTVKVVGNHFYDNRDSARSVAFVSDLFVVGAFTFAGGLLDGTLDVIVGHVVGFGLCDNVLQLIVVIRVGAAFSYGNGDFTADFGKYFAACRVGFFFFMLNC